METNFSQKLTGHPVPVFTTSYQVHINVQERITYPAITFCYKNKADQGYDLRMLKVSRRILKNYRATVKLA